MISVRNLTKRFGSRVAVNGISFEVQRGEVLGFLGPNGAGKTTTMRMITGFLHPNAGTAVVGGVDVLEDPVTVKSKIGYLPEGAPSYPDMTVVDFLRFAAEIRGFRGDEQTQAVDRVLKICQLSGVTNQVIGTLSKGYRQRVGVANAIIHDPPVLILDEPTDGLDPNQKHEVRALIKNLATEKAIVLSTHILEEVDAVCTRAIIMSEGRIVADQSPSDLLKRATRHGLVSLKLETPDLKKTVSELESLGPIEQVVVDTEDKSVAHQAGPGCPPRRGP